MAARQGDHGAVTRSLTTKLEYDAVGNLKRAISPRAWDASGDKIAFSDYVTEYVYDEIDQLVRVDLPVKGTETRTYLHRAYDANGNLSSLSIPVQKADASTLTDDEKTSFTHFDPGWIRTSDDPANPAVHFEYTPEGWQSERTPELADDSERLDAGQQILWHYYADGQLREVTDKRGIGFTVYTYDANGNLTKANEGKGRVSNDEPAIDVEASYDGFDRLTKVRHQKVGSANWVFTTFGYDLNGNVIARSDNGEEQADGTLVKAARMHEFTYDGADWLETQLDHGKDGSGTGDDRLITNAFTPTGWEELRRIQSRDGLGDFTVTKQETDWTWFANGKLKTLGTRNGSGAELEKHTVSYLDPAGVYANGHRTKDVFRLRGPNTSANCRDDDCETRYVYDARERLVKEETVRGGTTKATSYTLDAAGNIRTQTKDGVETIFDYVGNQLTKLTRGTQVQNYFYDTQGNLDCVTTGDGVYSNCNSAEGDSVSPKVYADYAYDGFNRLQGLRTFRTDGSTSAADKEAAYTHDALDRVAEQTEQHGTADPKTIAFRYLGLSSLAAGEEHTDSAGALVKTKEYSYDAYGNRISLTDTPSGGSSSMFTYGYDVHGSVSLLVDAAGAAKASYGYDAYGAEDAELTQGDKIQSAADTEGSRTDPLNPYRYTAKRYEYEGQRSGANTGMLDMGARRFGPDIAHFLQADLYHDALANLGLSTDPLTQNRYALAGGNPVSFLEIDGHRVDESGNGTGTFTPNPNPLTGERSSATWDHYVSSNTGKNAALATTTGRPPMTKMIAPPGDDGGGIGGFFADRWGDVKDAGSYLSENASDGADFVRDNTPDPIRDAVATAAGVGAKIAGGLAVGVKRVTLEARTIGGYVMRGAAYVKRAPRALGGVAGGVSQLLKDALSPINRSAGERLGRAALAFTANAVGTAVGVAVASSCTAGAIVFTAGAVTPGCLVAGMVIGTATSYALSRVGSRVSEELGWGAL